MMHMNRITPERGVTGLIRLFLAFTACAGWYVSFQFSVMGFNAIRSGMMWAAYGIVLFNTGLQVMVNHQDEDDHPNLTLTLSGIISYGYGIITNVMGILVIGGTTITAVIANIHRDWWLLALAICLGVPLELAPESMLMKAIFPKSRNMVSDAMSSIGNMVGSLFNRYSDNETVARPTVSSMRNTSSRGGGRRRLEELQNQYRPEQQPVVRSASSLNRPEPTYHPVGMEDGDDLDDMD